MSVELNLALIQSSLVWENPAENRRLFEKKIASISSDVDMIVLPEMFTTGFTMTPDNLQATEGENTLSWMKQMAQKTNAALVGSLPFYENDSFTNRLFFVEPTGQCHQYDKRHTFTLAGENNIYEAGLDRLIIEYRGFRFCPLVCYDLRFPVWARNTENYDALLFVANWPKPRISAWDTLLKARAIENMAYCVGVNRIGTDELGHEYPGHSAVYDCLGEQLVFSQEEEIIYGLLSKDHIQTTRNKLKFLADRDNFSLLS